VLVIGAGNSGAEIATDLVEQGASYVAVSVRTPPPVVPRDFLGTPVQVFAMMLTPLPPRLADRIGRALARLATGDLAPYGLTRPAWLPFSARRVATIDVGFVAQLKQGRMTIRPDVTRFTSSGVVYQDGRAEEFDAVIAATGFSSGLDRLIDLPGLLDEHGIPLAPSGRPTPYPGLYFMGYTYSLRGHLFEANLASRRLARNLATLMRQRQRAGTAMPVAREA
jgi:cation diffusion facilitator CzcD-associated flavoprotein CzcO